MDVRTLLDEATVSGRNPNGCKDASGRSCGFRIETKIDVRTLLDEAAVLRLKPRWTIDA
jgi:hypothetical protein